MKWYTKLLIALLCILLSPFIVVSIIFLAVTYPFRLAGQIKEYKKSRYYNDFSEKYKSAINSLPEYLFYNAMCDKFKELNITYTHRKGCPDYFEYCGTLYFFNEFQSMKVVDGTLKGIYRKYREESLCNIEQQAEILKLSLPDDLKNLPVKLIVERTIIEDDFISEEQVPDCLFVVNSYENALEQTNRKILSTVPRNAKQLYDMLMLTDNLGGKFTLINDEMIHWESKGLFVEIDEDCISINTNSSRTKNLTHWHPEREVYNDVCAITTKGNCLVIKKSFEATSILYIGLSKDCTYKPKKTPFYTIYRFDTD